MKKASKKCFGHNAANAAGCAVFLYFIDSVSPTIDNRIGGIGLILEAWRSRYESDVLARFVM